MKNILIFMGAFLLLTTESHAQIGQRMNPSQRTCLSAVTVQRAISSLDLGGVKNQLARKLGLPVSGAQRQHIFNLETQSINRMRGPVGNRYCYYYTSDSSAPVYTIRLF